MPLLTGYVSGERPVLHDLGCTGNELELRARNNAVEPTAAHGIAFETAPFALLSGR